MVSVKVADTFYLRFKGLLGKKTMPSGEGLLIRPCKQVHMFFMRFPIDVVFLDKHCLIVGLKENLRPWSISPYVKEATQVLELEVGAIQAYDLSIGQEIKDFIFFT